MDLSVLFKAIANHCFYLPKPMMQNMTVKMMNPISWIGLRPIVSTVATVTQYPGMAPAQTSIMLPTDKLVTGVSKKYVTIERDF